MAVQLPRIALPVAEGLQEAVGQFDCVGEKHGDDPVAAEVCLFLRESSFAHGIEHGYSSTYILVDDEQPMPREILATEIAVTGSWCFDSWPIWR